MKKIVVGANEIEVKSLVPYVYDGGRGEKVLRITVDEKTVSFEELKSVLNGIEEPIQYFEDDAFKCEYVGYGTFEAQYKDGAFHVELHKTSITEQMSALLVANEKLTEALNALDEANGVASATIAMLEEQNAMLMECLMEMSEIVYA